jgi:hypothetical protein
MQESTAQCLAPTSGTKISPSTSNCELPLLFYHAAFHQCA